MLPVRAGGHVDVAGRRAPVAFDLPGAAALAGEVLAAAEPHRLSYSVQAGEGQPSTYVTWEVSGAGDGGSVVRLSVNEPDDLTADGPAPEAATAWSQVVEALASVLVTAPAL